MALYVAMVWSVRSCSRFGIEESLTVELSVASERGRWKGK
jgi:hypothetical protein